VQRPRRRHDEAELGRRRTDAGLDFAFTTWNANYLELYAAGVTAYPSSVAMAHATVWAP
jgi:hypothetical protein